MVVEMACLIWLNAALSSPAKTPTFDPLRQLQPARGLVQRTQMFADLLEVGFIGGYFGRSARLEQRPDFFVQLPGQRCSCFWRRLLSDSRRCHSLACGKP